MAHARPWHSGSEFTTGTRRALSRDERKIWLCRADMVRRNGGITALQMEVGRALLQRLGQDGQLDPSLATLAAAAACSTRTVQRALRALNDCGLLTWERRLVRAGWRAEQTSNAYRLVPDGEAPAVPRCRPRCGGQPGRESRLSMYQKHQDGPLVDRGAAIAALAQVAERRNQIAIQERMARLAALNTAMVRLPPGFSPTGAAR